ncbi:MAG: hypothetical protein A3F68_08900 [Acidobacteria bacterium RIFCSPLOWO2_12_FULL_54_10]|nr:MAG: hypothetical protein A3F68_08900 [Acidobacteria bacterium RIFCSPLOWO2_12_FULL_54_10]OFW12039.1 MAG: hypothetical protein A3H27_11675 [Acidobacteria bacterium RIFCSPLOWO2_02_FULL_59_13]
MKTMIFQSVCFVALVATAILATGCGTAQSPRRQVDDITITAQVKAKLASDVVPSTVTNIEVNTTNGIVTLAGQVESEEVRNRAEQVAQSVAGVVRINNNLQVEAPPIGAQNQTEGSPPPR